MNGSWSVLFHPDIPWSLIWAAAGLLCLACIRAATSGAARTIPLRLLAGFCLLIFMSGPELIHAERQPIEATALLVVDKSASMTLAGRAKIRDQAESILKQRIAALGGDIRLLTVPVSGESETDLYEALAEASADIPPAERAGAILLTDGQIHDMPQELSHLQDFGPVHALLTGAPDLPDRKLEILSAPAYGMTGSTADIEVRVTSPTEPAGTVLTVKATDDNGADRVFSAQVGVPLAIPLPLAHAGDNSLKVEAESLPGELTTRNNIAVLSVKGVRDRLRVLLVSGSPNMALRVWRDTLKADPAIDLVHFTILRTPFKRDSTPAKEMALIEFPVRELFERRLKDFDLIIFDSFKNRLLLPDAYLDNIARYVENGGALLESGGALALASESASATDHDAPDIMGAAGTLSQGSIFTSPLARILPASPDGGVVSGPFLPQLTDAGERHPVTRDLPRAWGHWLALARMKALDGATVLMHGPDDLPLLVLADEGRGRVAEMASNQMWLWARGFDGGGPQADLIRHIVHWLLRAPDLEGEALRATPADTATAAGGEPGGQLTIERQTLKDDAPQVTLTGPDGSSQTLTMPAPTDGISRLSVPGLAPGLYHMRSGQEDAHAMIGPTAKLREWEDVQATDAILKPLADATGGSVHWLKTGMDTPDLYLSGPANRYRDGLRMGLRKSGAWRVTGAAARPLLPPIATLAFLILLALAVWRREAKA